MGLTIKNLHVEFPMVSHDSNAAMARTQPHTKGAQGKEPFPDNWQTISQPYITTIFGSPRKSCQNVILWFRIWQLNHRLTNQWKRNMYLCFPLQFRDTKQDQVSLLDTYKLLLVLDYQFFKRLKKASFLRNKIKKRPAWDVLEKFRTEVVKELMQKPTWRGCSLLFRSLPK